LLVDVLEKLNQSGQGILVLETIYKAAAFQSQLLKTPFPALKTLLLGLMEAKSSDVALRIFEFSDDMTNHNKQERG
jgi:hypothetical protein